MEINSEAISVIIKQEQREAGGNGFFQLLIGSVNGIAILIGFTPESNYILSV